MAHLETILVVDDMPPVLEVVVRILEEARFNVLKACCGQEALKISADCSDTIHLLLSDIQMPAMSGPELGKILKKTRPEMKVMLMSGLTHGDLLVLNYGWAFIQKPFIKAKLVEMVNNVLHNPDRSQSPNGFSSLTD